MRAFLVHTPALVCASLCAFGASAGANEALTAVPASVPAPEKFSLVLSPEPMTRLYKSLELRHALVVKESKLLDGDAPRTQLEQLEMETRLWIRHFDDFTEPAEGVAPVFRRRFDDIRLDAQASRPGPEGVQTDTLFADSPLNGKSIVFTQLDNGEYARYYDVEEGPEELLPRLALDTNLTCLLPSTEVEPGDEWELPLQGLRDLFGYAGDIELVFSREINDILLARNLLFGVGGSLWHAFVEPPQGTAKATFKEVREVQGRQMAVVGLEFDFTCAVDQTELASKKRNAIEITSGMEVAEARLQVKLEGDGDYFWDLDQNLPFKLKLVCAEEVYTSRQWKERPVGVPQLVPVNPSEDVTLLGVVRIELTTSTK